MDIRKALSIEKLKPILKKHLFNVVLVVKIITNAQIHYYVFTEIILGITVYNAFEWLVLVRALD